MIRGAPAAGGSRAIHWAMAKNRRTPARPPAPPPKPDHLDQLLDEAESESFPASDPIAVTPRRKPVGIKPEPGKRSG